MSRVTTRLLLAFSIFIVLIVIAFAMKFAIAGKESAWAVIAASLAVITSVVSSWNAQRIVELEEDKQLPYPYPYIDTKGRYGVVLLRIKNFGQSAAHDVTIDFSDELLDIHNEPITFDHSENGTEIPILLPQQSITKTLGGHIDFFGQEKELKYRGNIQFKNSSGVKIEHPFIIDAEMYRNTITYDDESIKTHVELQKIPKAINELTKTLESK